MLQTVSRGAEIARRLIQNQRQIDMLQLEQSRLCAEFAETDHWSDEGSNTPLDWIRFNCNVTEKVAGDRLAVGQRCGEIAASVRAMKSGEVALSHLAVMARTTLATRPKFSETRLSRAPPTTYPCQTLS